MEQKLTVKLYSNHEVRRLAITRKELSYDKVKSLIQQLLVIQLDDGVHSLRYIDDENEKITISSELEFQEATSLPCNSSLLKLYIEKAQTPQPPRPPHQRVHFGQHGCGQRRPQYHSPSWHHGAYCDHCKRQIVGLRFKCNDCADYDLCQDCVTIPREQVHEVKHSFQKIERPRWGGRYPFFYSGHARNSAAGVVHRATCDHCNTQIVGIRYKCKDCPDYDLCQECVKIERKLVHDVNHNFETIERPRCPYFARHPFCPRQTASEPARNPTPTPTPDSPPASKPVVTPTPTPTPTPTSPSPVVIPAEEEVREKVEVKKEEEVVEPVMKEIVLNAKKLKDMGFGSMKENIQLLKANNNDLSAALDHFLNF